MAKTVEFISRAAKSIKGTVYVPGDKSISHRALIFASLASGRSTITNLLNSADCLSTMRCFQDLGVSIVSDKGLITVEGVGTSGLKEPKNILDVGNSGTTLRTLPGVLAGQDFISILTGDESIRSRPMGRIIGPLREMGAEIVGRDGDRLAPIAIKGKRLKGISYTTPVASAQVKTSILLAGLFANGVTTVTEKYQSRDHTERFFEFFEIDYKKEIGDASEVSISVEGGQHFKGADMIVAGDISSAAFFIAAALIADDGDLSIVDVGLNPTRIGILEVLEQMGAKIEVTDQKIFTNEPVGTIRIRNQELKATKIGGPIIPRIIDELPILAVIASQARGETIVTDAAELRVKESDRIEKLTMELRKMGVDIEERDDGFIVSGPTELKGAVVDSHHDHRLAMSLAIAGTIASGETVIRNSQSIDVSYPGFESTLDRITEH